jgi:hypothetical protein
MCQPLTRRDERDLGALVRLCPAYPEHLAESLGLDEEPGPALNLFRPLNATTAIVEHEYFDIDFRSEFTATQETTFTASWPDADRIHFFDGPPPSRSMRMYEFLSRASADQASRETMSASSRGSSARRRAATRYLGYTILRSSSPTVGRTMVAPNAGHDELLETHSIQDHVRTLVSESVTVFGVPLLTIGVPFMQQDGMLLRCANATAWMAHYTSVLRGYVPRRPSAAFAALSGPQELAYGRPYPTEYVTALHQANILQARDLPPEVLRFERLITGRALRWTDRTAFGDAVTTREKIVNKKDREAAVKLTWFVENLTASVCRYLNSGFPAILNLGDHSYLVCGYVRSEHLKQPGDNHPSDIDSRAVASFLVNDDSRGPYRLLALSNILERVQNGDQISVLVPLPRGLWLDGSAAETAGLRAFESLLGQRKTETGFDSHVEKLREDLLNAIDKNKPSQRFGVRSFVSVSSDFKRDFAQRSADRVAARVAGYAFMPKFVWSVEIYDRDLLAASAPAVVGTVVLDGSSVSDDGVIRPPAPVFVHLPGEVASPRELGDDDDPLDWTRVSVTAYQSGRWSTRNSTFANADRFSARVKTSMAAGRT